MHQAFLEEVRCKYKLQPTAQPEHGGRPHTIRTVDPTTKQQVPISRIDDVLATVAPHTHVPDAPPASGNNKSATHNTTIVPTDTWHTDHHGLQWECPYPLLGVIPPPPLIPTYTDDGHRKLKTPMSQSDKTKLTQALQEHMDIALSVYNSRIQDLLIDRQLNNSLPSKERIEDLGKELMDLLAHAKEHALATCATVPAVAHPMHCRPRKAKAQRNTARNTRKHLGEWMAAATDEEAQLIAERHERVQNVLLEAEASRTEVSGMGGDDDENATKEVTYKAARAILNKKINAIDREHMTFSEQQARKQFQKFADTKQKLGNRIATGAQASRNTMTLKAVMDPENDSDITTCPSRITDIITTLCQSKLAAPAEANMHLDGGMPKRQRAQQGTGAATLPTGGERQDDSLSAYPWQLPGAPDQFDLAAADPGLANLDAIMADESTFRTCVDTLANNKAPGPDGVANEILKALPKPGHQAIHGLLQLMWATGHTPEAWKHSNTILLYKNKGHFTDLTNYRRVGLENTIYKLWTRMVTHRPGGLWRAAGHP
jgi:hypothetical protein